MTLKGFGLIIEMQLHCMIFSIKLICCDDVPYFYQFKSFNFVSQLLACEVFMKNEYLIINFLLGLNTLLLSIVAFFLLDLKRQFEKKLDTMEEKVDEIKEKYVSKEYCSYHLRYHKRFGVASNE